MDEQKRQSLDDAMHALAGARTGALSVVDPETGGPYGALVNIAVTADLCPVILVSSLARHTQGLLKDNRASLLVHADLPAEGDALTTLRLTVTGIFRKSDSDAARQAYLTRHPYAEHYAGFGDFSFWTLVPSKLHVVAGFGRIHTYDFSALSALLVVPSFRKRALIAPQA